MHGAGDALPHFDRGRRDISARAAQKGQRGVLVRVCTDARVDADRADIHAVAAVAGDRVDRVHASRKQRVKITEQILLAAEHAAEVVACPGGVGADRDVGLSHGAGGALVKGAVSAAGVYAQLLSALRFGTDLCRRVLRRLCHIDFPFLIPALGKGRDDLCADLLGLIASSCDGVDDEQMLHFSFVLTAFSFYI